MGVFDNSNEGPGRTDNNAKNLISLWFTVSKKIKKKTLKVTIFKQKNNNFFLRGRVGEKFVLKLKGQIQLKL